MKMKALILMAAALVASVSFGQAASGQTANKAQYASLASARSKITQVIDNPKEMTAVMKTLSPENQKAFLAEVVAAISAMPAAESDRTGKFVDVVNAALAGSQKGNALTLVAEVFATVPPTALAAVNESLSSGLMNRAADPNTTFTDEQYIKISKSVMEKVNERVANEDNAGVRSGFAALMLIRGSNSESPEITAAVVESLPATVQNDAKTEWIPAALGKGQAKTYDPMLAVVDNTGNGPATDDATAAATPAPTAAQSSGQATEGESIIGLRVSGVQNFDSLLADIGGAASDPTATADAANPIVDAVQNSINYELPNLGTGDAASDANSAVTEVENYSNQTTGNEATGN